MTLEAEDAYTWSSPEGATVFSPTGAATRDSVAASLRLLAQRSAGGRRSIAVLGEFDAEPAAALEDHDYIGRLAVRLNIAQLVVVGTGGRHIHSAAGLEGSWDGESVIVATPEGAYDLLRGQLGGNDVVLVKASERVGLGPLVDRLTGGAR